MRFMMLVKSAENSGPPPKALMDAIGRMAEEATKAGLMLQSGGLAPTAMSSPVRLSRGRPTTTDGPFAESKEAIGGLAFFESKSREEAIKSAVNLMKLHKQHWPGWDGETEVRQIFAPEDWSPCNRWQTLAGGARCGKRLAVRHDDYGFHPRGAARLL